eukprot:5964835-Amphidinium_carterae.1
MIVNVLGTYFCTAKRAQKEVRKGPKHYQANLIDNREFVGPKTMPHHMERKHQAIRNLYMY